MVLVGTVGEVETSDVHTGPEKLLKHGNGARCGTQRANDLGLWDTTIVWEFLQNSLYVYVRHFSTLNKIYYSQL